MLHKVVLTFESVDETLVCESYWAVLSGNVEYIDETLMWDYSNEIENVPITDETEIFFLL